MKEDKAEPKAFNTEETMRWEMITDLFSMVGYAPFYEKVKKNDVVLFLKSIEVLSA